MKKSMLAFLIASCVVVATAAPAGTESASLGKHSDDAGRVKHVFDKRLGRESGRVEETLADCTTVPGENGALTSSSKEIEL